MNPDNVLVAGAGAMGHGIAQVFARAGFAVDLADTSQPCLDRALALIRASLGTLAATGRLRTEEIDPVLSRIRTHVGFSQAAPRAGLVVEAVPESPEIKKSLFAALDALCPPEAVFASNTSGLDVFSLVPERRTARTVATHFFAPAQIIPLVELCPGPATLPALVSEMEELLLRLGKTPVVLKKFVPSFIVNRIQNFIGMAVFEMLQNGWADPDQIDRAVKASLGVRLPVVGVVQTLDFTGLDCVQAIAKASGASIPAVDALVALGCLGAKSGRGFYDYGGRSEEEILALRDERLLGMIDAVKRVRADEPV